MLICLIWVKMPVNRNISHVWVIRNSHCDCKLIVLCDMVETIIELLKNAHYDLLLYIFGSVWYTTYVAKINYAPLTI